MGGDSLVPPILLIPGVQKALIPKEPRNTLNTRNKALLRVFCIFRGSWRLLAPAKFSFQLAEVHLGDCGPAMGTGIRHGAVAQVLDKVLQFPARQWIVGLDGVTANGLGDGVFAQAQ